MFILKYDRKTHHILTTNILKSVSLQTNQPFLMKPNSYALIFLLSFLFSCQSNPALNKHPEYALYAPYFGTHHQFSKEDLKRMANDFDFVYGQTLSTAEMDSARMFNPRIKFIKYIGGWTVSAKNAEPTLKRDLIYYPFAKLKGKISKNTKSFKLKPFGEKENIELRASTTSADHSKDITKYVIWIRVGKELMKVKAFDPETNTVTVQRNFDGRAIASHAQDEIVFLPAYGVAPGNNDHYGNPKPVSYHYDPASEARWDMIYGRLKDFMAEGGNGIWIDILMDGSLREKDINGNELPFLKKHGNPILHAFWNFETDSFYYRDGYRANNEKGVNYIQQKYVKEYGKQPIIYGNNMMASRFDDGFGGHKYYLMQTKVKPHPLDGMCIEDWMGGYDRDDWIRYRQTGEFFTPGKACFPCNKDYKNWKQNLQELMKCSQSGLAAMPLIINAGMKTATFEGVPREQRHQWELWAYASYLLGVEKKDGVCSTKLGIPMFYVGNGKRFVDIDPMYFWKIGEPAQTFSPSEIDKYVKPETIVYTRRFTGGLVLVNPSDNAYSFSLKNKMTDPDTGQKINKVTMKPKSGRILLN